MIEDEEMDTSDWAVPPETEKMLRERITSLEARINELHQTIRGHEADLVEVRDENRLLETALERADDLRTAAFKLRSWYGEPSVCIDCNPVAGEHEVDCGVLDSMYEAKLVMNAYLSARNEVKP